MSGDDFDLDLFVIGGGSGGVRAARIAAEHGAKVGLAEEYRYGGVCVIRGCVPKKLMVYASQFCEHFEDSRGFGWRVEPPVFDWSRFLAAKDAEIARLERIYKANLEKAGVALFDERAEIAGPHEVRLHKFGKVVRAKHILVAVGSVPSVPDFAGAHDAITSNEVFHLPALPKSMIVAGGGYIACEFACIMNGLGVETTLIYRKDQILNGFDGEVRDHVQAQMAQKGVRFIFRSTIDMIERQDVGFRVHLSNGEVIHGEQVLLATGRVPNTSGLGLENAGLALRSNGAIPVNAFSQTAVPSIFAVGDVTDRINLTPVAIREGHRFADTVFGAVPRSIDYSLVPTAVFTQPEIGTVGLKEEEARGKGDIEVYKSAFKPMIHTLSGREERMLMKVIVDKRNRQVLGVHLVGHGAGEMIQCISVAVKMGATKEDFDATMAVHPTAAEELVTMRTPVA